MLVIYDNLNIKGHNMSTQKIYFMDFIKDNFKDLKILEEVFIKNLYRRGHILNTIIKDYKNVFELIYLQNKQTCDFRNIFSAYIVWSESYLALGYSGSSDISKIHYKWQTLVDTISKNEIFFEKGEFFKLQINFEGE